MGWPVLLAKKKSFLDFQLLYERWAYYQYALGELMTALI